MIAIHRRCGRRRVERAEHQVAGLGGLDRDRDRLEIAHLADEQMSGSSRSAARSASLNESVCVCTSRWLTRHSLFSCTNSIGSSIVMM
jgi:hypothetical protein